ncbi:MAG TPA: hypothetical protein VJ505_07585 [Holophagaceae bacterium]|nr:hypothetical protein [Holophagaceae bacterium]
MSLSRSLPAFRGPLPSGRGGRAAGLCALVCLLAAGSLGAGAATPPADLSKPLSAAERIRATRAFDEPLLPIGGHPQAEDDEALWSALQAYTQAGNTEKVEPILGFLKAHPNTPWRASLLTDLGLAYRHTGYFTRALDTWEQAWTVSKGETSLEGRRVADRAVCELIELNSRIGRMDRLRELFGEIQGRTLLGSASERVNRLRDGLWLMEHEPGTSFRCGPLALMACATALGRPQAQSAFEQCLSTQQGTSLAQNEAWAKSQGLPMRAAFRSPGSEVRVPAVIHWRAGHFAALVKADGDRFLMKDPTFGEEFWISRAALDTEASGYALVPQGALPKGWRAVGTEEAQSVHGKGTIGYMPVGGPYNNPPKPPKCQGMPVYSFDLPYVALEFNDNPVGYRPPRGYPVNFELSYTQQDTYQPQTFTYSNVGPLWTFSWTAYITDDPANPGQNVTLYSTHGGQSTFTGYNATTGAFTPEFHTQDLPQKTGAAAYTLTHADGSMDVYAQPNGATTYPRLVFLTQRIDPAGNALTYTYDAQMRLVSVQDALGQVTTLSYGLPSDPLKLTKVTDPFGRSATLTYTASGQLASITDAMGLTSSFAYGPNSSTPAATANFINAMTTPYGTTTFAMGGPALGKWVVATDAMGNQERMEFGQSVPGYTPVSQFPAGFSDPYLYSRNVFYWDKRAMALAPGNYNLSTVYHFLHDPVHTNAMSCILEGVKKPLEGWTFNTYPGQTGYPISEGTGSQPSAVERLLDDGSTQANKYLYNSFGKVTQATDPSGRVTSYLYDANGLDLLEVHNITGGQDDLLAKYGNYVQHRPQTITDASGQVTTFHYNAAGQVLSITNPKNETTSLTYDANGYLQSIQGPVAGALTSFTYDSVGRIRTVTNPDSYTLTYDYDALDRRTKVTYPDASTEQTTFTALDATATKDRLNRWTLMTYNALRQLTQVQDPAGRVTTLNWCGCGSLDSLVDPKGNITNWSRDLEGRVTAKIYPDLSATTYAYDGIGRLSQRTDAMGQITNYSYYLDNNLKGVAYSNATVATPSAAYLYETRYNRLSASSGGTGTTTYTYNPVTTPPALGATRLATVTSPMPNSDIAYGYDELGRVTSRSIHGVAETRAFDSLGRLSTVTNPLGTFGYSYDGATNRLLKMTYPNGQVTNYSYLDNAGDKRLQSIQNLKSDASNISTFAYTYDATGQIQSWSRQADAQTPTVYTYTYDPVGQLLGATLTNSATSQVLSSYGYGYDDSGNRTTEQINGAVTTSSYNDLNQLTGQSFSATPSLAGPKGGATPAAHGPGKSGGLPRRLRKPVQPRAPKAPASHSASRVDEVTK